MKTARATILPVNKHHGLYQESICSNTPFKKKKSYYMRYLVKNIIHVYFNVNMVHVISPGIFPQKTDVNGITRRGR